MPLTYSVTVHYGGRPLPAKIVVQHRQHGVHYEVNIPDYPRFMLRYGPLGRYEMLRPSSQIPEELVLAVNDAMERDMKGG